MVATRTLPPISWPIDFISSCMCSKLSRIVARPLVEDPPCRRGRHRFAVPAQQLGLEPRFQVFDLLADGRLCDEVAHCGARKAPALHQVTKNLQGFDLHKNPPTHGPSANHGCLYRCISISYSDPDIKVFHFRCRITGQIRIVSFLVTRSACGS